MCVTASVRLHVRSCVCVCVRACICVWARVCTRADVTLCYMCYRQGGPRQGIQYYRQSLVERRQYTVLLHCVTGGENEDNALQYYTQPLVERRRCTLLFVLQADRTKTRRYSVTDNRFYNAGVHCVT